MSKGKLTMAVTVIAAVAVPAAVMMLASCTVPGITGGDGPKFYFSDTDADRWNDKLPSMTADELAGYQTKYGDAVGTYFRDKLSGDDLYIYNAVSYAVDNSYTCIYFPDEYYTEGADISDIVTMYSCDSPFLEHNYTADGRFTLSSLTAKSGVLSGETLYYFELPRNMPDFTARKTEAYNKAKKIVSEMSCTSELEKARYLYGYVAENASYRDSSTYNYNTVPIYDTLINGRTICDGFADTLMLLYNLAGIPAFTVEGVNTEGGHVLNIAQIGGQYYYFDVSADSNACKAGFDGKFYFCMSDATTDKYFAAEDELKPFLPVCRTDAVTSSADITINSVNETTWIKTAADKLKNNGTILVKFGTAVKEDDKKKFGEEIAKILGKQIGTASYNGLTGYRLLQ